jgi:hypothetical protein
MTYHHRQVPIRSLAMLIVYLLVASTPTYLMRQPGQANNAPHIRLFDSSWLVGLFKVAIIG